MLSISSSTPVMPQSGWPAETKAKTETRTGVEIETEVEAEVGIEAEAKAENEASPTQRDAYAHRETPLEIVRPGVSSLRDLRVIQSDPAFQKKSVDEFHEIVAAFQNHWGCNWDNFYLRAKHLDAAQKTVLLEAIAHPNDLLLNSCPPDDANSEKLGAIIQSLSRPQLQRIDEKFGVARQDETGKSPLPAGMRARRPALRGAYIAKKPAALHPNRVLWNAVLRPIIRNALTLCTESAASTSQPEDGTMLDKFYACAAYMSTDEKTEAIRDVMELSSKGCLPRPGKIDVEKFRSIAIDLNQEQRQSLRKWFLEVAFDGLRGGRMQYQALLFQIFDDFPILELNTATKGVVSMTKGQTFFTPELLDALKFKRVSARQ